MGTCVSKCYSSDPFIHLDSDQLKDKLVVTETSPPLPPTSSVSSSSAASVSSPNPTTHSAFSSSSAPSSSYSSSSLVAPSAESSSKKPLPSTETNAIISVKEAESQSDRKHAPPAPRATKQQPLARTSTVTMPAKRVRSCSPAAIAERRSFARSTRGGAASPPRVPRSRSLVARKESVRSAANPGRASSMNRGGVALLNQTDSQVFQKGSNSIVGQSVAVEELDNPLISMDCFIFI